MAFLILFLAAIWAGAQNALAGGGSFRSLAPTPHATTNAQIVERFLRHCHQFFCVVFHVHLLCE